MENKICFRCKKLIEENSNYYAFTEYDKEKFVNVNYTHRKCWDDFLDQLTTLKDAKGMLKGMKSKLTEMGILEPEKVVLDL